MAERDNRLISSAQILTSALPLAISLSPYCNDALALKEQQSATMIPDALMRLPVAGHPGLHLALLNATAATQLGQKPWNHGHLL
jgi:hypothetical protein